MAETSPTDPMKARELCLPKDINDDIEAFQQKYGGRKIDWIQYLIHEMHLDRFMKSMKTAKNMEINEEKKDNIEENKEEEKESEEPSITNELNSNLRENNKDMYRELDEYISRNQKEELEDVDSCESEENDIFCGSSHEQTDMESANKGRFEESDSDNESNEQRSLRHNYNK